jgi:hypothetical protein
MCKHEMKKCPRCSTAFECKVGSVLLCQCTGIEFTDEEKSFIAKNYNDCLCRNCLLSIKQSFVKNATTLANLF